MKASELRPGIEVVLTNKRLPQESHPVLVAGGLAIYADGEWLSLQDKPHRKIEWEVLWWAEIPNSVMPPEGGSAIAPYTMQCPLGLDGTGMVCSVGTCDECRSTRLPPQLQGEQKRQDDEGWIEWAGGECPVNGETLVRIRLRRYGEHEEKASRWDWSWRKSHDGYDITHYRVVEQPPAKYRPFASAEEFKPILVGAWW